MKYISTFVTSIAACASVYAADIRVDANISEDTVWTSENTYILDAQVYVIDGASLTIEPGTVVKGAALTSGASALIITRGSKIYALGTPTDPIIFTAEADPLDGSYGINQTNLWGGVIILGDAPLNSESRGTEGDFTANPQVPFTDNIEGLDNSTSNTFTEFGGLNSEDSSGIFRYVSIRHGGSLLSTNNEINGLTMAGVGSGTIIEFVEVFANKDDSFEWFGGTVDARFLVAAFGNDDAFDYDQGWTGRGQFWFSIGTQITGEEQDHAGEHDGTVDFTQTGLSRGMGTIFNATYIGPGSSSGTGEGAFEINDDAGVRYYNSIFTQWGGPAVDVVDPDGRFGLTELEDNVTRIDFRNNIWFDNGDGSVSDLATAADVVTFLTEAVKSNTIEDPMLRGVSRTDDGGLDPRPAAASPAFSNVLQEVPNDGWYIDAEFQGAFGSNNWMLGWTKLATDGYLAESSPVVATAPVAISTVTRVPEGAGQFSNFGIDIAGDLPRMFIIRGLAKKLIDSGFLEADVIAKPQITVRNFQTKEDIAVETQWLDREDPIEALSSYVGLATLNSDPGATPNPRPTLDDEAAVLLISLNPGTYVIKFEDEDELGGAGQIEMYLTDL